MTANPVQEVLVADAGAQEEIAQARREAEESSARDRAQARALAARAETRVRASLARFEEKQKEARNAEAQALEKTASVRHTAVETAVRKNRDRTISEVIEEFWPK
jgi:hypothetical protein